MTGPSGSDAGGPSAHDDTDQLPVVTPPGGRADADDADLGPPSGGPGAHAEAGEAGRDPWWRWVVLTVVVALLGAAAANAWLAGRIEHRVAAEMERELGAPVDVRLEGFPVGFRSLDGRLPGAELHGRDVPLPDTSAALSEVRLSLTELRVDRDRGRVEAASAHVAATLDESSVEDLLGALVRLPLVGIELQPGALRLNVAGFAVADATARADDGDVVVGLAAPLDQLIPGELRLDELPLGLHVDSVRLDTGEMEVRGRIEPLVIDSRR